ncbi:hypothetical protein [Parabacteroides sp. FAFU027]|uniref:hypothetical protein n=1 Tax=Parabacteroides sp. FAFU027 TaxID=2922715 RepID=UPI001FAF90A1|nr:hypothetical protein [Parabacteroides sp. FAFU027]
MKLEQRRLWDYREFTLSDKEINIRMESPMEDIELTLKYEDLGFETAYVRKKSLGVVLAVIIFTGLVIGSLIWKNLTFTTPSSWIVVASSLIIFIIFLLIVYVDRKPQIVIKGGKESFSILADSPNKQEVDKFIQTLHERMTQRIIDIEIRPDDPKMEYSAQKEALETLLDNEVISREKFEEVIKQLKEKQRSKPAIGF